jgi:hypothetical protein
MNTLLIIVILVLILLLSGTAVELLAEKRDRRRYHPPGKLVNAGGSRIHLILTGDRSTCKPLVLLEAGMGSWSFYWWVG